MSDVQLVVNGQPRQVSAGTTVSQLLDELELPPRQVAVEVNRNLIPREIHAQHALGAGDIVEVVTLVGGG